MIETYLLEQLLAISDHGTISAASEALHVSQPSISRSMQKLEGLLEVELFDRTKNKVTLNENGTLAAEYAARILQLHADMEEGVRALDRSRNTISIGSSAPGPLMDLIPLLSRLFPGRPITSEVLEEEKLLEGFQKNLYQLLVLDHPLEDADLFSTVCGSEHLYVTVPPAYPAPREGIRFKDMDGETFIRNTNVGFWSERTESAMPHARFILQDELEDLDQLVRSSSLPSFVTDLTMRLYGIQENRVAIPFLDEEAHATYHLHCRQTKKPEFAPLLRQLPIQ